MKLMSSKCASYHVVHVLAWWHSGDALEGEVHRGDLLKYFSLSIKCDADMSRYILLEYQGCTPSSTSFSGGIAQLRSQSQAPFPSETVAAALSPSMLYDCDQAGGFQVDTD